MSVFVVVVVLFFSLFMLPSFRWILHFCNHTKQIFPIWNHIHHLRWYISETTDINGLVRMIIDIHRISKLIASIDRRSIWLWQLIQFGTLHCQLQSIDCFFLLSIDLSLQLLCFHIANRNYKFIIILWNVHVQNCFWFGS